MTHLRWVVAQPCDAIVEVVDHKDVAAIHRNADIIFLAAGIGVTGEGG